MSSFYLRSTLNGAERIINELSVQASYDGHMTLSGAIPELPKTGTYSRGNGVVQVERNASSYGVPRFTRVHLTLHYDNEQGLRDALFHWAKSDNKKFDAQLDFRQGGQTVRTIKLAKAECLGFTETGEFSLDGQGLGMQQKLELLVPDIAPA